MDVCHPVKSWCDLSWIPSFCYTLSNTHQLQSDLALSFCCKESSKLLQLHTQQDWSRFGSRSGAIPKYLIQHRGESTQHQNYGTLKEMVPMGTKMLPLWQMGPIWPPPSIEWHHFGKWCPLYRFLLQSCFVCTCVPLMELMGHKFRSFS